ncbi:hypothetical protein ACFL45_04045 [Candidatus Neomarinimicrobiota bacterium]
MSTTLLRVTGAGLFFLFIFLSGFWLSRIGKPYHTLIFNVHKFLVLAAVVFLVIILTRMNQGAKPNVAEFAVIVATALLFIAAIISGGLASLPRSMPAVLTTLHHLLPYATVLATAVIFYLMLHRT